jgi:hypothetical protein
MTLLRCSRLHACCASRIKLAVIAIAMDIIAACLHELSRCLAHFLVRISIADGFCWFGL